MTIAKRKRASSPIANASGRSKILKALDEVEENEHKNESPGHVSNAPLSSPANENHSKDGNLPEFPYKESTAACDIVDEVSHSPDKVFLDVNG
jgi:hypothetical protein